MERTWRWFGKNDKITLAMLREIGVQGIVTALHDVPNGEVWTRERISDLRKYIESYGMRWSVVESLPVSEAIKYAGPERDRLIENYKESLKNLALEGIHTVCYNFMPVLDWARTDLSHPNPNGTTNRVSTSGIHSSCTSIQVIASSTRNSPWHSQRFSGTRNSADNSDAPDAHTQSEARFHENACPRNRNSHRNSAPAIIFSLPSPSSIRRFSLVP